MNAIEGEVPSLPIEGEVPSLPIEGEVPSLPIEGEVPSLPIEGEAPSLPIGCVNYLNAAPLVYGLPTCERALAKRKGPRESPGPLSVVFGSPRQIADDLLDGLFDIALLPLAAAASIGHLEMLPLGVASKGPVRSVVVVSACPLEAIDELLLDLSSRTSVVLVRLELAARGVFPKRFRSVSPADALAGIAGTTAALLIGDVAIDLGSRYPYSLDLAQAFAERTGHPFVFAAWFGRKGALTSKVVSALRAAYEEGKGHLVELAGRHHETLESGLTGTPVGSRSANPPSSYLSYLDELTYVLGEAELAGARHFLREASQAGYLPEFALELCCNSVSLAGDGGLGQSRVRGKTTSIDALLEKAASGERLSHAEGVLLGKYADVWSLGLAANEVRKRKNPEPLVTYIVDRNVNYTNICTTSCTFCAFYRPVGHAESYVLSREALAQKLSEVVDAGGVQILLQGGLNPNLRIEYYEELFQWVKQTFHLGLHALSPEEIGHLSRLEGLSVSAVLTRLKQAGLDSVPGGGAEVLVDRVRRKIAKAKCTTAEWLGVMRTAHQLGLRSSATMMYGTVDTLDERIAHLLRLRDLQDETGGFTAFFCWDCQHEQGTRQAPGDHGVPLYLRTQALARLFLDNFDHVGASWVTQGPLVGQVALHFGADDWGSVMFEENVVSAAGTTYRLDAAGVEALVLDAGFKPVRRNVRYEHLTSPTMTSP